MSQQQHRTDPTVEVLRLPAGATDADWHDAVTALGPVPRARCSAAVTVDLDSARVAPTTRPPSAGRQRRQDATATEELAPLLGRGLHAGTRLLLGRPGHPQFAGRPDQGAGQR